MVRNWWRISPRPVGPTFLWAKKSIWKSSFEPLSTRINRRVHDSASLEWSVSFEAAIGLLVGSTAKAVVTDPETKEESRLFATEWTDKVHQQVQWIVL